MTVLAALHLPAQVTTPAGIIVVAGGAVAAAMGLYLVLLSVAALFYRDPERDGAPDNRLIVLIPAHNETALIARCVASLKAQNYAADRYQIVVIADNCTDDTGAIAAAAGADRVMRRHAPDARGKGQALRWAIDQLLGEEPDAAAVVVVDADSVADPDFLAGLVRRFQGGAPVVQALYLLAGDEPAAEALGVLAFRLVNLVRQAGRAALGFPAALAGNGMLFSREVLLSNPWTAFTSTEDLEYSLTLQLAGVRVAFARDAVLVAPPAPNDRAAEQQQLRWHGGKTHLARVWVPKLIAGAIRSRRPALLGAALDLALPPLALLTAAILAGVAAGVILWLAGVVAVWALVPWLVAAVCIPISVLVGLRAGDAPAASYRALARAPFYVFKMATRARRVLTFTGDTWVRTERRGEFE